MQTLAIRTEMSDEGWAGASPEAKEGFTTRLNDVIPLGKGNGYERLQPATETAWFNVFMFSGKATFITGQLIGLDGGMVMGR